MKVCLVGVLIFLTGWGAVLQSFQVSSSSSATPGVQPPANSRRTVNVRYLQDYVATIEQVLNRVHESYHFEAIPMESLAGRAILGLYRKGKLPAPEALARDPDRYFAKIPGNSLKDKLKTAREEVGDVPDIMGELGIYASLDAVFATLDPFSSFAPVDESIRMSAENGAGIGIFLEDKPLGGACFVRNIVLGSLAQQKGMTPGDELLEVNQSLITPDTSTARVLINIAQAFQSRNGVSLLVRKLSGEKKLLEIRQGFQSQERFLQQPGIVMSFNSDPAGSFVYGYRRLENQEWDFWINRKLGIAYFRLGIILQDTPALMTTALQQMTPLGLKAIILDLRECPSGIPAEAAELAGMFLESGARIATTKYRNPAERDDENREFKARGNEKPRWLGLPLAVLVGPDTSGAAEMVAAALQDLKRAKIIGQRTRGKSTIQSSRRDQGNNRTRGGLQLNYSIKLSAGMFARPSGKNLHRLSQHTYADDWGVRPDVEVVLPALMRRQVRAWWFEHDLRPLNSVEPTKLDDTRNDPVLDAALRALQQQVQAQ